MDPNGSLANRIEQLVEGYRAEKVVPGIAVSVTIGGETVYARGFGQARQGTGRTATPIGPDTIMSIQSITKSFAAASIMHLVEEEKVELDAPVVRYLPHFRTRDKTASDTITVRQLMSHTAGLPFNVGIANAICPNRGEFHGYMDWAQKQGFTHEMLDAVRSREDITRYFERVELAYSPGTDWAYCTDAYAIVGDLFDRVAGQPWEEHVVERILDPLGMERTTFSANEVRLDADSALYYQPPLIRLRQEEPIPGSPEAQDAGRVTDHDDADRDEAKLQLKQVNTTSELAEVPFPTNPIASPIGFLYSTAADMARYLAAYMVDDSPILRRDSIGTLHTPIGKIPDDLRLPGWDGRYGLGWMVFERNGIKLVGHGGGYTGVSAFVLMRPEHKLGVTVLTNRGAIRPGELCLQLIELVDAFQKSDR